MTFSMYDASLPTITRALTNLRGLLSKGQEHVTANGIAAEAIMNFRLYPNMLPFGWQVYIAADTAKSGAARLGGITAPSFEDTQMTFEDLDARIAATLEFLDSIKPAQIEGSESKEIVTMRRGVESRHSGRDYLFGFILPNLFFHISMVHAILRHNGVDVGKADYLGLK